MTPFQIYLFTRLELINTISGLFSTLFGIVTAILTTMFFLTYDSSLYEKDHKITTRALKLFCPLFIMNLFVYTAVPTQKEMAAIVVLPKIASQQNIDKLTQTTEAGFDIIKLSTEYLRDTLKIKVKNNNDNVGQKP